MKLVNAFAIALAQGGAAAAATGPDPAANEAFLVWGVILAAAAIVLFLMEIVIPSGGLLALLCGVAAIASLIVFFRYDSLVGSIVLLCYLVLGPIAVAGAFKLWRSSPLARQMILGDDESERGLSDEEAFAASEQRRLQRMRELEALVGVEGVAVTELRPVGVVKVDGRRIDGLSEIGVIPAGTPIVVAAVYDNQVKVRPKA